MSVPEPSLVRAYVAIGSSIEPETNIQAALNLLAERVVIRGLSNFYQTPALYRPEDPPFYNGVVAIDTGIEPWPLKFDILRNIELALGRDRDADGFAPRTIDLDVVLYGSQVLDIDGLHLPDPDIRARPFIALPLIELDPELRMPDTGHLLRDHYQTVPKGTMKYLAEYTALLKGHFVR